MKRSGFKVKIRGIYATALSKLLVDHDFCVVQPSVEMAHRLGADVSEETPDLAIRDRYDLQGVEITGTAEAIDALRFVLGEELFDVVLREKNERSLLDAQFPWASKVRLDDCRETLTPTVKMHHFYKACGGFISSSVDMAENLLCRGRPWDEIEALFRRTIDPYLPWEGSELSVEHVKLVGRILNLGNAVIEECTEGLVRYNREIRSSGAYDGLGVTREAGDKAVTDSTVPNYYSTTRYFSSGGNFKGLYINLSTPLELYPEKIRYVDLEVDVCLWPNGEARIIDQEMLDIAVSKGIITHRLYEAVKEDSNRLLCSARQLL